ncbi:MAG: hypothetical protein ACR2KQ_11360 [Actinomycetota bacterium]
MKLPKDEPDKSFAPPDSFIGPRLQIRYSRWARAGVSLGPTGRIIATLLLVVAPVAFLLVTVFPFAIVYLVAAWPILLPALWRKTPVRSGESLNNKSD